MKFIRKISLLSSFLILLFVSSLSFASTAQMHTTLTRINTILNQINPLINLAEQQQDPNIRVKFQFITLREDVSHIQAGIAQALHRVSIQPRVVAPLIGDYLPVSESILAKQAPIQNEDAES
jgi:RAQPRD family integrative conjugative element protein